MTWRYQMTRDEEGYSIREVYAIKHEDDLAWTKAPIAAFGETPEDLIEDLMRMLDDAQSFPVLDVREKTND